MDSPARPHLPDEAGLEGEPLTEAMVGHFDACLGCMACVTACPSGVQYDRLIEATRAQVERRAPTAAARPAAARGDLRAVPAPAAAAAAARPAARPTSAPGCSALVRRSGVLDRLSPTLAAMEALAPPLVRRRRRRCPSGSPPAASAARWSGMLTGCVQREFFPRVNAATARVLADGGLRRRHPARPGLLRRAERAQRPRGGGAGASPAAPSTSSRPPGVEHVVVNAAGCGSSMKEYAELLRRRPGVRRAGRRVRRQGARRVRAARRARPGRRAASAAGDRRLPRRLPPRARAGRAGPAARPAARHPRARAARDRRRRRSAAARPASTTC